jgi:hypothetical protein
MSVSLQANPPATRQLQRVTLPQPHGNGTVLKGKESKIAKFFTNILAKPLRKVYDYPKIRLKRLHPYL